MAYGPVFAVALPAGEHRVTVTTAASLITISALGFWLIAIAVVAYLLRVWWGRLSDPPASSGGIATTLRRWLFEPPFVREFAVQGGTLRVCEPRTGRRLDVRTRDGGYRRIESSSAEGSIALVLVELSASANERVEFDFARLILRSVEGQEFRATPVDDLQSDDSLIPNPVHLLDAKNSLLDPIIEIGPSEVIRGYVAFEYSTSEEYPFVHGSFVNLR